METSDIFVSRDVKFHENEFFATVHYEIVNESNVHCEKNVGVDVSFMDDLESILSVPPTDETTRPTSELRGELDGHGMAVEQPGDDGRQLSDSSLQESALPTCSTSL